MLETACHERTFTQSKSAIANAVISTNQDRKIKEIIASNATSINGKAIQSIFLKLEGFPIKNQPSSRKEKVASRSILQSKFHNNPVPSHQGSVIVSSSPASKMYGCSVGNESN